jgi:hypothetical protein
VYVDGAVIPNATVIITDAAGTDKVVSKMTHSIDISNLSPGVYILRVEAGNRYYYEKLTVK